MGLITGISAAFELGWLWGIGLGLIGGLGFGLVMALVFTNWPNDLRGSSKHRNTDHERLPNDKTKEIE